MRQFVLGSFSLLLLMGTVLGAGIGEPSSPAPSHLAPAAIHPSVGPPTVVKTGNCHVSPGPCLISGINVTTSESVIVFFSETSTSPPSTTVFTDKDTSGDTFANQSLSFYNGMGVLIQTILSPHAATNEVFNFSVNSGSPVMCYVIVTTGPAGADGVAPAGTFTGTISGNTAKATIQGAVPIQELVLGMWITQSAALPTYTATGGSTILAQNTITTRYSSATAYIDLFGLGTQNISVNISSIQFVGAVVIGLYAALGPAPVTSVHATNETPTAITWNWTQSAGPGLLNETVILFKGSSCAATRLGIFSTGGPAISYKSTGLSLITSYALKVFAWNASGISQPSNCATAMTTLYPWDPAYFIAQNECTAVLSPFCQVTGSGVYGIGEWLLVLEANDARIGNSLTISDVNFDTFTLLATCYTQGFSIYSHVWITYSPSVEFFAPNVITVQGTRADLGFMAVQAYVMKGPIGIQYVVSGTCPYQNGTGASILMTSFLNATTSVWMGFSLVAPISAISVGGTTVSQPGVTPCMTNICAFPFPFSFFSGYKNFTQNGTVNTSIAYSGFDQSTVVMFGVLLGYINNATVVVGGPTPSVPPSSKSTLAVVTVSVIVVVMITAIYRIRRGR